MILSYGFFVLFTFFICVTSFTLIVRAWLTFKKDEEINFETPLVSIIVPAYNEEVGIVDSINSLLKQDYSNFEVIIIDDGSTDNTSGEVISNFKYHPKITFLMKDNGGKASALNFGASYAKGEYLMCIDGDTVLEKHALSTMMKYKKEDTDGLAAMVGIFNGLDIQNSSPIDPQVPKKISTRIQWLEYCRSYVAFRCSMKEKNVITVISGACGIISKNMFDKCGGYKEDQLGEDMELTMNIHSNGGKVQFIPETLAWTEAPRDIKSLGKQRLRWFRGSLQALTLHKNLLFGKNNFTFKWLLLPYIWVSDIFGVWIEFSAWLYTFYLLIIDAPMDWTNWAFIWGCIIIGHYINTSLVILFVKNKLEVPYKKMYRGFLLSLFEGVTYHFLYVFWLLKAHLQHIFKVSKKWNKLDRVGLNKVN